MVGDLIGMTHGFVAKKEEATKIPITLLSMVGSLESLKGVCLSVRVRTPPHAGASYPTKLRSNHPSIGQWH